MLERMNYGPCELVRLPDQPLVVPLVMPISDAKDPNGKKARLEKAENQIIMDETIIVEQLNKELDSALEGRKFTEFFGNIHAAEFNYDYPYRLVKFNTSEGYLFEQVKIKKKLSRPGQFKAIAKPGDEFEGSEINEYLIDFRFEIPNH